MRRYLSLTTSFLLLNQSALAAVQFNAAFAASQYTSLSTFLATPWEYVAQMTELFGTRWSVALSDDYDGTLGDLENVISVNSTLHYIWTLMVPLHEDIKEGRQNHIQKLYVGLINGAFIGYQIEYNSCPGSAYVLISDSQKCPQTNPVRGAPAGTSPNDQSHCRLFFEGSPHIDCTSGQVRDPTWSNSVCGKWYDPRVRPWYKSIDKSAPLVKAFTGPFVFSNGIEIGITASQGIYNAQGIFLGVAAADIFISTLENILIAATSVEPTRYTLFIVDNYGKMIAASVGGVSVVGLKQVDSTLCLDPIVSAAASFITSTLGGWEKAAASSPSCGGSQCVYTMSAPKRGLFWVLTRAYKDAYGLDWYIVTVEAVRCEANYFAEIAGATQSSASPTQVQTGEECSPCPAGSICRGGRWLPTPEKSLWVPLKASSIELINQPQACLHPSNCLGANSEPLLDCFKSSHHFVLCNSSTFATQCSEGSTGVLCGHCKLGYTMRSNGCATCIGSNFELPVIYIALLLFIVLFVGFIFTPKLKPLLKDAWGRCLKAHSPSEDERQSRFSTVATNGYQFFTENKDIGSALKILQSTSQIVSAVHSQVGLSNPWPQPFSNLTGVYKFLALSLIGYIPSGCSGERFGYYTKVFIQTIFPLAVVSILQLLAALPPSWRDISGIRLTTCKYYQILVLNIMLPPTTVVLVNFFVAVGIQDKSTYLTTDLAVQVLQADGKLNSTWSNFAPYVWVMIGIYPIGIPLYFTYVLYKNRRDILMSGDDEESDNPSQSKDVDDESDLKVKWALEKRLTMALEADENHLEAIAFLFESYRLTYVTLFAEVIDVCRRMVLSAFVVFFGSNPVERSLWGIVLSGAWLLFFDSYRPFRRAPNNTLAHICNFTVLFTFVLAFMVSDNPINNAQGTLGWIVFFANMFMFLVFFLQQVTLFRDFLTKKPRASSKHSKSANDDDLEYPDEHRISSKIPENINPVNASNPNNKFQITVPSNDEAEQEDGQQRNKAGVYQVASFREDALPPRDPLRRKMTETGL